MGFEPFVEESIEGVRVLRELDKIQIFFMTLTLILVFNLVFKAHVRRKKNMTLLSRESRVRIPAPSFAGFVTRVVSFHLSETLFSHL